MSEVTLLLNADDLIAIGGELEKLFAFQDRPLPNEKKLLLTAELGKLGYPTWAIVKGIRSLLLEDLKAVKMVILVNAIKQQLGEENAQKMAQKEKELSDLKERLYAQRNGVGT